MSIHIDSEDYATGSRYNGTWNFNRSISNVYKIISQSFEVQDVPWAWAETNEIIIEVDTEEYQFAPISTSDIDTYGLENDKTTLADYFETRWNNLGAAVTPSFSTTWVFNNLLNRFEVTFDQEVTINWGESLCRGWFNKLIDSETSTVFYLNAIYITTSPRFLYGTITESISKYVTSKSFAPTFILSTQDSELIGQEIIFRSSVSSLNIKMYLVNVDYEPVPLSAGWELILVK